MSQDDVRLALEEMRLRSREMRKKTSDFQVQAFLGWMEACVNDALARMKEPRPTLRRAGRSADDGSDLAMILVSELTALVRLARKVGFRGTGSIGVEAREAALPFEDFEC